MSLQSLLGSGVLVSILVRDAGLAEKARQGHTRGARWGNSREEKHTCDLPSKKADSTGS